MEKIYLGRNLDNEKVYLTKHTWDCGWYWGFGYLGNNNNHYHFETYLNERMYEIKDVFKITKLTQEDWWILLDLFKIAYAYKEASKAMLFGGHMSQSAAGLRVTAPSNIIPEMNKLLENQLDNIWNFLKGKLN